jgi:hypothetical protein
MGPVDEMRLVVWAGLGGTIKHVWSLAVIFYAALIAQMLTAFDLSTWNLHWIAPPAAEINHRLLPV